MLLTFAFGLASVFMLNNSLQFSDEVPVNLPQTESGEIIVVLPETSCRMFHPGGGGGSGAAVNKDYRSKSNKYFIEKGKEEYRRAKKK